MSDLRYKKAKEIQDAISQILRFDWNPIGFSELPLDEYDDYIGPVYKILIGSRSEDDLIEYLELTACVTIFGMPEKFSKAACEELRPIAKKLLALDVKI